MNTDAAGQDDSPDEALEQAVHKEVQAARQETSRDAIAGQALADQTNLDKRERIVLARRRSSRPVVRTLAEVEDLTDVGQALLKRLVRMQLLLSIRLLLLIVVVLVSIPLAFLLAPSLGTTNILGLPLPWWLLGFAVYPFFVAVAWFYNRSANRTDQFFAEWVEN
jgi:putative solute:sodium symporter small subunit